MSLMFLEPARPAPNSRSGSFWNEERDAQLMDLWSKGVSASEIAGVLGAKSRNAVIGRIHRARDKADRSGFAIDFARRAKAPAHPANWKRPRGDTGGGAVTSIRNKGGENGLNLNSSRPRVDLTTSNVAPDESRLCLLPELEWGMCRFPIDRDGQQFYCGAPWRAYDAENDRQSWYCGFHHQKTHKPIDRTKRGSTFRYRNT